MIGKIIYINGDPDSTIRYIIGGKDGKHQVVKVIDYNGFALSKKQISAIEDIAMTPERYAERLGAMQGITREIAPVFMARASAADKRVINPYEHFIIGYSPEDDGILTDELRRTVCREFLEGIGMHGDCGEYGAGKRRAKKGAYNRDVIYLACSHNGTNAKHEHIICCRVDQYGKVNNTRNDWYRSLSVARSLSKKYHLHLRLNSFEVTEKNGYTISKKHYSVNLKEANQYYSCQEQVGQAALECLDASMTLGEFRESLARRGITLGHSSNGAKAGNVNIYTTTMDDGREVSFSGTQLCKARLTFAKVSEVMERHSRELEVLSVYHHSWDTLFRPYFENLLGTMKEVADICRKYNVAIKTVSEEKRRLLSDANLLQQKIDAINSSLRSTKEASGSILLISAIIFSYAPVPAFLCMVFGEAVLAVCVLAKFVNREVLKREKSSAFDKITTLKEQLDQLRQAKEIPGKELDVLKQRSAKFDEAYDSLKRRMSLVTIASRFAEIAKIVPYNVAGESHSGDMPVDIGDMYIIHIGELPHLAVYVDDHLYFTKEPYSDAKDYMGPRTEWTDFDGRYYDFDGKFFTPSIIDMASAGYPVSQGMFDTLNEQREKEMISIKEGLEKVIEKNYKRGLRKASVKDFCIKCFDDKQVYASALMKRPGEKDYSEIKIHYEGGVLTDGVAAPDTDVRLRGELVRFTKMVKGNFKVMLDNPVPNPQGYAAFNSISDHGRHIAVYTNGKFLVSESIDVNYTPDLDNLNFVSEEKKKMTLPEFSRYFREIEEAKRRRQEEMKRQAEEKRRQEEARREAELERWIEQKRRLQEEERRQKEASELNEESEEIQPVRRTRRMRF